MDGHRGIISSAGPQMRLKQSAQASGEEGEEAPENPKLPQGKRDRASRRQACANEQQLRHMAIMYTCPKRRRRCTYVCRIVINQGWQRSPQEDSGGPVKLSLFCGCTATLYESPRPMPIVHQRSQ